MKCTFAWKAAIAASLLGLATSVFAECKLSVGWEPWEPYQFERDGQVTGLDNDLLKAMAQAAECELTFVKLPWKRLLEDLKRGKIDLTSAASKNEEREAYALFSAPYREETMVLYVRKGEAGKHAVSSFADMISRNFKLGVVRDYFYGDAYGEAMKNPEFTKLVSDVSTDLQNFKKLESGRVDGILADRFVGPDLIRQNGLQGKFEVHLMPVSSSGIHLMFSRESTKPELVERFNAALEKVRADGTYDRILNQYLQ